MSNNAVDVAPFIDRRKRYRLPPVTTIIGVFFLLMPAYNYLGVCQALGLPLSDFSGVRAALDWPGQALLLVAPVVGIGILRVRRWGWLLFLAYAPVLIAYDVGIMLRYERAYNWGALAQSAAVFGAMFHFLRRDAFAPYLHSGPRGFRRAARRPVNARCEIEGESHAVVNLGTGGCFVEWSTCPYRPGEEVAIDLKVGGQTLRISCGVVRIESGGVGLAFRRLSDADRALLGTAVS